MATVEGNWFQQQVCCWLAHCRQGDRKTGQEIKRSQSWPQYESINAPSPKHIWRWIDTCISMSQNNSEKEDAEKAQAESLCAVARNQIHCIDALGGLQQLPDNSIDLIITSPPYWCFETMGYKGKSVWKVTSTSTSKSC